LMRSNPDIKTVEEATLVLKKIEAENAMFGEPVEPIKEEEINVDEE